VVQLLRLVKGLQVYSVRWLVDTLEKRVLQPYDKYKYDPTLKGADAQSTAVAVAPVAVPSQAAKVSNQLLSTMMPSD
jgi:hypothetical protein